MRIVNVFVEEMMLVTGCDKETAYKLAYETCPSDINPNEEVTEEEAASLRKEMELVLGPRNQPTMN